MLVNKQYGLINLPIPIGMGNVLTTVSDRKIPHTSDNITIDYYTADITSAQDYYAFGMLMPGRNWSSDSYKFGFNGKEKDDEVKGSGNSYDFGARIYDSRVGRWLSLDPLQTKYPSLSPYQFCANNPILLIDPDGKIILIHYINENGENQTYEYGSKQKVPDNKFVQTTIQTLGAISKNESAGKVINNISSSTSKTLNITGPGKDVDSYTPISINKTTKEVIPEGSTNVVSTDIEINEGTVTWDPNMGISFGENKTTSPATALFHEIGHGYSSFFTTNSYVQRCTQPIGAPFDNKEEEYNITTFEHLISKFFGEPLRDTHGDSYVETDSPTSNREITTTEDQLGEGTIVDLKGAGNSY